MARASWSAASLHVGEKTPVNYRIEATNPGGHSSAPVRDNAIYELADALVRSTDKPVDAQRHDPRLQRRLDRR